MKKCVNCGQAVVEKTAKTPENINYNYYSCKNRGGEIIDVKQLHLLARKHVESRARNTFI